KFIRIITKRFTNCSDNRINNSIMIGELGICKE
ncbi:MAG: hypothetical protein EZS28_045544, partial [Streblomastix strix]